MMPLAAAALVLALAPGAAPQSSAGQQPCDAPAYRLLDFWVGSWDVHLSAEPGRKVGTNVIEKTLNGCAILEHWQDVLGGAGRSLFYFHRPDDAWKQVWVTDTGRVKEKRTVPAPAGAVRFQGVLRLDDGRQILDRTTLTPMSGDRVRQHIEQSTDEGATWTTTFDAIYAKR